MHTLSVKSAYNIRLPIHLSISTLLCADIAIYNKLKLYVYINKSVTKNDSVVQSNMFSKWTATNSQI